MESASDGRDILGLEVDRWQHCHRRHRRWLMGPLPRYASEAEIERSGRWMKEVKVSSCRERGEDFGQTGDCFGQRAQSVCPWDWATELGTRRVHFSTPVADGWSIQQPGREGMRSREDDA